MCTQAARLAAERCDVRSALEVEAYAAWMAGTALLEREGAWQAALAKFVRAKWVGTDVEHDGVLCVCCVCVCCDTMMMMD